jgi:hypothetical protein
MKKFFGFGSSTPPPPAPPSRPPAPPSRPSTPGAKPVAAASPIVGRWKEPQGSDTTEFHADGTVTESPAGSEKIRGRYTLEGAKLKIRLEGVPDELSLSAVFKGDALEMTGPDGQMTRYEKIA